MYMFDGTDVTLKLYDGTDPNLCNGRAQYELSQFVKAQPDNRAQASTSEYDSPAFPFVKLSVTNPVCRQQTASQWQPIQMQPTNTFRLYVQSPNLRTDRRVSMIIKLCHKKQPYIGLH